MTQPAWAFGVDMGGTKINVAVVDASGKLLRHKILQTKAKEKPQVIIDDIIAAINELRNEEKTNGPCCGVGIGIAGQIEKKTGHVHFAPNLGWKDFPLQK